MKRIFCTLSLVIFFFLFVESETIKFSIISQMVPFKNNQSGWDVEDQYYIVGELNGGDVYLFFNKITTEAHVFIKKNGIYMSEYTLSKPTVFSIDMTNKPRGHYFIEIYTDDTALGGEFELE